MSSIEPGGPASCRNPRRGFVLLEVTLATAIFCLVAVALVGALGAIADSVRRINRGAGMRLGLSSQAAEALALPVEIGLKTDKPDPEGVVYEREWKVLHLVNQDKTELPGMYELAVRARWTEDGKEEIEESRVTVYRSHQ